MTQEHTTGPRTSPTGGPVHRDALCFSCGDIVRNFHKDISRSAIPQFDGRFVGSEGESLGVDIRSHGAEGGLQDHQQRCRTVICELCA